jgi:GNAT superfamily N-acetyltransferase
MARMQTRYVDRLTIRPLCDGDTETVASLFAQLGDRSRARRFGGAKPRLSAAELEALARVDVTHHVLVAYVDGDPRPAGIARLVRCGESAEVACAVADVHQGRGVGETLTRELAADARAAGIVRFEATVCGDNPQAVSMLARCAATLDVSWRGGERAFVIGL